MLRRPLLCVCLCGILLIWLLQAAGVLLAGQRAIEQFSLPEDREILTVEGTVAERTGKGPVLADLRILSGLAEGSAEAALPKRFRLQVVTEDGDFASDCAYGSRLILAGTFRPYAHAGNPGEFDAADYYGDLDYIGTLRDPEVLEIREGEGTALKWRIRNALSRFREKCLRRIRRVYPAREASVMADLLLGEREGLDRDIKGLFQANGIAHILSISGLHISIIGLTIFRLLRKTCLPVPVCCVIPMGILGAYVLLTGGSISAVRAAGTVILLLLARALGRTPDPPTALGLLAFLLLLRSPAALRSASFLLSFGALLGILLIAPTLQALWEGLFPKKEKIRFLREDTGHPLWEGIRKLAEPLPGALLLTLRISLGLQLATLPVTLWFYYEVPRYAMLLNLLVLPFMTLLLVAGFLSLVPGLGIVGTVSYQILRLMEYLCGLFDRLPGRSWNPGRPRVWMMVTYVVVWLLIAGICSEAGQRFTAALCGRLRFALRFHCGRSHPRAIQQDRTFRPFADLKEIRKAAKKGGKKEIKNGGKEETGKEIKKGGKEESRKEIKKGGKEENRKEIKKESRKEIKNGIRKEASAEGEKTVRGSKFVHTLAALLGLLSVAAFALPRTVPGSVTFLSVGQGDAIFLVTEGREVYLVDGGSTSRERVGEYVIKPFLKYMGCSRIDGIFLSHPDADHVSGLEELVAGRDVWGLRIGGIYVTPQALAEDAELMDALQKSASEESFRRRIPVRTIAAGDTWQSGETAVSCLHPAADFRAEDPNESSMCLLVTLREAGPLLLLTGDIQGAGEECLMEALRELPVFSVSADATCPDVTASRASARDAAAPGTSGSGEISAPGDAHPPLILKVAHHGSRYSTPAEFLTLTRPALSVISAPERSIYGHPHAELLERLTDAGTVTLRTDRCGAITVLTTKQGTIRLSVNEKGGMSKN
ncbi:MAG: ComEC/Rec2 family competence protein [Lachnospiraceae bacterium]|nr:ComEC/Rec2 family competence protein [Lachnospiraceae bacterium]